MIFLHFVQLLLDANLQLSVSLRVDLWPEPNREDNVFGSKAVGEPPFMRAISVLEVPAARPE